ncbi:methylenetetrahydrofolate reductase [Cucumibacter marinus]|uniref:methylenetetrahydrofolate reductase n=1 Tax=Cucumibacter marinus TaxID=1121252 RepID=UPI00040FA38E|nr:methylenetetrahydrofolate reductase [Cucumibacter marinus]
MSALESAPDLKTVTDERDALAALAAGASFEVTASAYDKLPSPGAMPAGTRVYLPFLPGAAFADNVELCGRLAGAGMRPIPHLAARSVVSEAELEAALPRYVEAGADGILLIAGDPDEPQGPYADTMQLLESGILIRHGINRIGVAGHPEGHPRAGNDVLLDALRFKQAYAREQSIDMWVTTQFVFEADQLAQWDRELRDAGIDMPVHVGIPGPAKMRTLLSFALSCGVGTSMRMLQKRPGAARLLGRWSPDELLSNIAAHVAATPHSLIEGVHIYPFGGLNGALEWRAGYLTTHAWV